MNVTSLRLVHTDLVWRDPPRRSFAWYAMGFMERLANAMEVPLKMEGPCRMTEKLAEGEVLAIIPPWKGFQAKKDFERLDFLCRLSGTNPFIVIGDDYYRMMWAAQYVKGRNAIAVTNHMLDLRTLLPQYHQHVSYGQYPWHRFEDGDNTKEPTHQFGYVGRYIPARLKVLNRTFKPDELLLCGQGFHNQNVFQSDYTRDGGAYWQNLMEVYKRARWQVILQDAKQIPFQTAVSRVGESLCARRPLVFHSSCCAARPHIDWTQVSPYVWSIRKELDNIMALHDSAEGRRKAVQVQSAFMLQQWMGRPDDAVIAVERMLRTQ